MNQKYTVDIEDFAGDNISVSFTMIIKKLEDNVYTEIKRIQMELPRMELDRLEKQIINEAKVIISMIRVAETAVPIEDLDAVLTKHYEMEV